MHLNQQAAVPNNLILCNNGKIGVFSGGKLIQNVFTLIPKLRPAVIIARQTELVVIVINWRLLQNRTNSSQDEIQTRCICTLTIVGNFFSGYKRLNVMQSLIQQLSVNCYFAFIFSSKFEKSIKRPF